MTPYELGKHDYAMGGIANPFLFDAKKNMDWARGWKIAEENDDDRVNGLPERDPRDAFNPTSEHFGEGVSPVADVVTDEQWDNMARELKDNRAMELLRSGKVLVVSNTCDGHWRAFSIHKTDAIRTDPADAIIAAAGDNDAA